MIKNVFCILLALFLFSQIILFASDKQRVAVLDFSLKGQIDREYASVLTENFTVALINAGKFIVVERSQLDKALKELKLQHKDDFDEATAVKIGKLTAAQVVIIGNVSLVEDYYYINVRGIEVETGVAKFGAKDKASSKKGLVELIDSLALSINKEVNLSPTVIENNLNDDDSSEIDDKDFVNDTNYDFITRKKIPFSLKSISISPKKRITKNLILRATENSINISRIYVKFRDKKEFDKPYDLTIKNGEIIVIAVAKEVKEIEKVVVDASSLKTSSKSKKGILYFFLD